MNGISHKRFRQQLKNIISASLIFTAIFNSPVTLAVDNKNEKKHSVKKQKKNSSKSTKSINAQLNAEINARIAGDLAAQNAINTLTLTAGPQGIPGVQGEQGAQGLIGPIGPQGAIGEPGVHCWDLNSDHQASPNEDINRDGSYNALDCQNTIEISQLLTDVQYLKERLANSDLDQDGYSPAEGDCNDANININPAALDDNLDGLDNDCDGNIDNDFVDTINLDTDNDGFTPAEGDCDDSNFHTNPAAADNTSDGIDNNCNGEVDENIPETLLVFDESFDSLQNWNTTGIVDLTPSGARIKNRGSLWTTIDNNQLGPVSIELDVLIPQRLDRGFTISVKKLTDDTFFKLREYETTESIQLHLPSRFEAEPFIIRIDLAESTSVFERDKYVIIDNVKVYIN